MTPVEKTIWGLSSAQLHDRYWASRGVQVVRCGEPSEIVRRAELFLLVDGGSLVLFPLSACLDVLYWTKPALLFVRLRDHRERGYRERAVVGENELFKSFQRLYGAADSRLARAALTQDRKLALLWQSAPSAREGWRRLRGAVPRKARHPLAVVGGAYDRRQEQELGEFSRRLVQTWKRPDAIVGRARRGKGGAWIDTAATVAPQAAFVGPVWVGAGRQVGQEACVVGPCLLWDEPASRPSVENLRWELIEPSLTPAEGVRRGRASSSFTRWSKAAFDLCFALVALVLTLPLYPLVMLAIWLEDGGPVFFVHRRETVGGREFPCIKFRSMRHDAERIKEHLAHKNQADGPQFFMDDDPRLTVVGRFLRQYSLDELPQFINVLLGHMSVVGPRPSPRAENQCCPAWREARLSMRPGITGLWQVSRTRRRGADFQEWIRYDIEYVERAGWRLDLWILWRTVVVVLRLGETGQAIGPQARVARAGGE
jgi:lipopolysaccharide/colanic/teichoic acid biosynthesis glycosyltransferase